MICLSIYQKANIFKYRQLSNITIVKTQNLLLKKRSPKRGWYWRVEYSKSGEIIFDAYAHPDTFYPVFQSGTLYIKRLDDADGQPVFEIELKNGKVKGEEEYGDGEEHTIRLYYAGKLELGKF
ncbi:hypothetical protein CCAN11_2480016 [Capnocytophaga canimorsus]|uniref:Uncharacterized protein n=1 Tax=Capnocytophaga canimorsus TaxID=28188 RepID=A0A0B7IL01_9FLAO|nr:hypothetical protein [Capnocytophaga canimorsus]CEN52586.1 hypothetical protein CCAN11_2480016 [Capnocytophaga canimorsus]